MGSSVVVQALELTIKRDLYMVFNEVYVTSIIKKACHDSHQQTHQTQQPSDTDAYQ